MKKLLTLLLLLAFASFLQAAEKPLTQITMSDITGKTYHISKTKGGLTIEGLEGKVIFLEFFGFGCRPCLMSIPKLINIQEKHKDKLAVIAVEAWGLDNNQLARFAKIKKINYSVATIEKSFALAKYIIQRTQWKDVVPFFVAIDTTGNIRFIHAGLIPESFLEKLFTQLSKTKTPTPKAPTQETNQSENNTSN